jgi:3-hydroxyisobutyrate dehydrogenase
MTISRIGFIGIGNMGKPMAANLARAGFDLCVYDANASTLRDFVSSHKARPAVALSALARTSECIVTMLPDDQAVRRVILGEGGDCVAQALEAGHVVVDMSTSDPTATQSLGAALSLRGVHVVDAPVMGGVAFARDATLDIMAGGDRDVIESLDHVFKAVGRKAYYCGPLGSGHALKVINNYVNACALISVLEGLTLGRRFGIDTTLMIETMQAMCTGRNHPIDKKIIPHVLTRSYGTGMTMGFIGKDLRIAVDAARRVEARVPLADHVCELWAQAARELGGQLDQSEIVRYFEQLNGVTL